MPALSPAARRVHLETSPWMLLPASRADEPGLCILLFLTCAASIAHWGWYRLGSAQHRLDCLFAGSTVLYLMVMGEAPVRVLTGCAVCVFAYGRNVAEAETLKLGAHTLFRFLAFWACCAQTGDAGLVAPVVVGSLSALFWLQVALILTDIKRSTW